MQEDYNSDWSHISSFLLFLFIALQTVQRQLDNDSEEIYPTEFMFADGQELQIHIEAPECQHVMQSPNKVVMTACIHSVNCIPFVGSVSIPDKYHAC